MTKQIKVSDKTHHELQQLKQKNNCKSIDEVINHLLQINRKYKDSEIVRLVKE